jgi:hypothetical protein
MRKKSHPTTIELVNHNPASNSYHKINYRKPIKLGLLAPKKEEEGKEKGDG